MNTRALRAAAAFEAAVLMLGLAACPDRSTAPSSQTRSPSASIKPLSGSWRRIAPPPGGARQEVTAADIGGKLYVAGGLLADGSATDRVEVYDRNLRRWSQAPPLPIPLHHAMAARFRLRLYVLGGITDAPRGGYSARVFLLDGDRWTEGPSMRRPRGAGAAVAINDELFVVGGINANGEVGPIEIFDGTSWRDGTAMPSPLDHIGATTDGRYLYAAGGRRNGNHFSAFQRYEPSFDRWVRLRSMPTARSGLGVAFVPGYVITVGGEGPRIFPEVEAFDIKRGTWTRLPDMGVPRHGVGTVANGLDVYAFLGGSKVGLAPSAVSEALSLRIPTTDDTVPVDP